MLFALWSVALLLGVRVLKRGLTPMGGVALMAVVGLAVVTKASSYALVPAALLALAVGAVRLPASRRRVLSMVAVALAALAIPVGTWLVTARVTDRPAVNQVATAPGEQTPSITNFNVRELGSYLWQYYLPRLPFQQRFGGLPEYPVYAIWLKGSWGTFGWLEVRFPKPVYLLFAAFTLAALVGAAVFLVRRRAELDLAIVAFFALVVLSLLAGLHWTEFRTLVGGTGPFTQGRYLLPLVSLFGVAVAAAIAVLPERRRVHGGRPRAGLHVRRAGLLVRDPDGALLCLVRVPA